MNNELTQEIAETRFRRLTSLTDEQITKAVSDAITAIAPGAMYALAGLDASEDGVTKTLWEQAVQAADSAGETTFPHAVRDSIYIEPDAEPITYDQAKAIVAGRVGRAIMIVNGLVDAEGGADDWYQL